MSEGSNQDRLAKLKARLIKTQKLRADTAAPIDTKPILETYKKVLEESAKVFQKDFETLDASNFSGFASHLSSISNRQELVGRLGIIVDPPRKNLQLQQEVEKVISAVIAQANEQLEPDNQITLDECRAPQEYKDDRGFPGR